MGITDGGQLVLANQATNRLSVYQAMTGEFVKSVSCPSPVCLLCRGETVYVASRNKNTINVFSTAGWKMTNEVATGLDDLNCISAPSGSRFKGEILAVSSKGGGSMVNIGADTRRLLPQVQRLATIDSTGAYLRQGDRLLPMNYVLKADKDRYLGGNTRFLYEAGNSDYWFSRSEIFGPDASRHSGSPAQNAGGSDLLPVRVASPQEPFATLVPDVSGRVFYKITPKTIAALTLDGAMTVKRLQNVPSSRLPFSGPPRPSTVPALGISAGEKVAIFVPDLESGQVYCFHGDLPAADNTDPDYACADGKFPVKAVMGKKLQFKLPGVAKDTKFTLVRGPDGASLSGDGALVWTPAKAGPADFKVRIEHGDDTSFEHYHVEVTAEQGGVSVAAGATPGRIALAPGACRLAYNCDGSKIILLNGKEISVLDADGRNVLVRASAKRTTSSSSTAPTTTSP